MNKQVLISLVVEYNEGFLWRGGPPFYLYAPHSWSFHEVSSFFFFSIDFMFNFELLNFKWWDDDSKFWSCCLYDAANESMVFAELSNIDELLANFANMSNSWVTG